jgi:HEPN domain-containing protein
VTSFQDLARAYLVKARVRRKTLDTFLAEEDFSDVVRESQSVVELAGKAVLRTIGVEPPKLHDVGSLILEYRDRLPAGPWDELARESKWLRKERELAFYGDVDFIPTDEYTRQDALRAITAADLAIILAGTVLEPKGVDDSR